MAKYRKKPILVVAVQFDSQARPLPQGVTEWKNDHWSNKGKSPKPTFSFINQSHVEAIRHGDWIVTSELGRSMSFLMVSSNNRTNR